MEAIRQWAANLCIGCILVGMLRALVPDKSRNKGINLVFTVYIVLCILTSPGKIDLVQMRSHLQQTPTISWEQLVQRTAEEQLTAWANRTLAEAGIDGSAAIAVESADGNRLTAVMTVDADDAEQARQLLQAQLGADAAIEFQEAME